MREEGAEADGLSGPRASGRRCVVRRTTLVRGDAPMDGDARPWERRLSNLWPWKGLA